jgi:hypothetical protein
MATTIGPVGRAVAARDGRVAPSETLATPSGRTAMVPWLALALAVVAAAWWLVPARPARDAEIAGLVRAFAVLKAVLLAGAYALLAWRAGQGITPRRLAGYGVVLAVMAVAPVLAWRNTAIPLAFVCFDGGLVALLLLALADDGGRARA